MATFRAAYPVFAPLIFDNETNEPIGYGNGVVIGRLMNVSTTDTYQIGTALSNFKHRFDSSAISLGTSEISIDAAIKIKNPITPVKKTASLLPLLSSNCFFNGLKKMITVAINETVEVMIFVQAMALI